MHTFIIAEIGSCHDLSYEKAVRLIGIAKDCGADAAKFQFWSSSDRMAQRRNAPGYRDIYEKGRVPLEWLLPLKEHCNEKHIEFMCSTYLPEDVSVVAKFVRRFKIASFEANDPLHLVAHVAALRAEGTVLYISMGMGARHDIIDRYLTAPLQQEIGVSPRWQIFLLHCVSAYPAPIDQLNLRRLREARDRLADVSAVPLLSGYSDHSAPSEEWTGALAVAAGAAIIERHLRSEYTLLENADYGHAMSPLGFANYVKNIRFTETALEGRDRSQLGSVPAEAAMRAYRVR